MADHCHPVFYMADDCHPAVSTIIGCWLMLLLFHMFCHDCVSDLVDTVADTMAICSD